MVRSPSWEANWFAASQEIPRILWNPEVHYRTHKCPPPVPILGQPNPVPIPTSHLLEIHPNIIHPSTPRSPHWSLSLLFPHQDPIRPPLLTHTCHMPSPSHSSRFNIVRIIQSKQDTQCMEQTTNHKTAMKIILKWIREHRFWKQKEHWAGSEQAGVCIFTTYCSKTHLNIIFTSTP